MAAAHSQQAQAPDARESVQGQQRPVPHRHRAGGLVVDYLGLADQLKQALVTYTESGGKGDPAYDTAQAIAVMLEKHGAVCDMLHGFDWSKWVTGKPAERLALIPAGQECVLEQDDGKKRFVQLVADLSKAFALCASGDEATAIRDDISFFQAIQGALVKHNPGSTKTPEQIDAAIRQLVSRAIAPEGEIIDVFTAAGLSRPDISIRQVRKSVTIDWTLRESARAEIRVMVKRILNKYGYPPDLQEEAVKTVLRQAELLCADWV